MSKKIALLALALGLAALYSGQHGGGEPDPQTLAKSRCETAQHVALKARQAAEDAHEKLRQGRIVARELREATDYATFTDKRTTESCN